ncbi:MAG: TSUP family transporter, partial [Halalkalicoccus sp.]
GMGFGTALAPTLFVLGYDPLQIVPILLVSEMATGLVAGGVHHVFSNVEFAVDPVNEATKLVVLFAGVGSLATVGSIVLVYAALSLPEAAIRIYVAVLVIAMGAIGVARAHLRTPLGYRPRLLIGFALAAGANKGIGGGGYGPVVTLGQILSGVYEKSATAITTLSEGIVSAVGVATFFALSIQGLAIDPLLLPSIYTGGFLAAIAAPYLVRVVPNAVWRYAIPGYAVCIGLAALVGGVSL